jgi:hypothetical protein
VAGVMLFLHEMRPVRRERVSSSEIHRTTLNGQPAREAHCEAKDQGEWRERGGQQHARCESYGSARGGLTLSAGNVTRGRQLGPVGSP